jgi:hypothetical protein
MSPDTRKLNAKLPSQDLTLVVQDLIEQMVSGKILSNEVWKRKSFRNQVCREILRQSSFFRLHVIEYKIHQNGKLNNGENVGYEL